MDNTQQYGQMNLNLPHDVVPLPSQGLFYKNKKKSLKVGYLTAQDENILLSTNGNKNIITTLLKNKIYEPDFNINELLDGDAEAILIFLRNTAFGSDYNFKLKDPKTGNVKKINFGDAKGGLSSKINDRDAARNFASRHNCDTKNDKTKAGYWACRLPKYAKDLGLKGGGDYFW